MEDREFIRPDNLNLYCNTNESLLKGTPTGIVIEFPGLGGGSCLGGSMDFGEYKTDYAQALAGQGILLLYTFPGPWSWMNKGAVRLCDLILDAAIEKYGMGECPIVSTGGSMGGLGALIFAADSRHKISAIAAACPNHDPLSTIFVLSHRPRTMLSAIAAYDTSLEDGLKAISPTYRIHDIPDIPIFITGDEYDECFDIADTEEFVRKLREDHRDVTYMRLENCKHGWFTREGRQALNEFVIRHAKG